MNTGLLYGISFLIVVLLIVRKTLHIWALRSSLKDAELEKNATLIQKHKQEISHGYKGIIAYGILYLLLGFLITLIANVLEK